MKQDAFEELVSSVRQAGRIRRGDARASRRFTYRAADVAAIRERLSKSQSEFAQMIGVSIATLQNWEQGRRVPNGPALALLRVVAANPRLVERALAPQSKRGAA
ncbi:MAG: NadS family protein [Gemmatimonadetes bacterium]|nr:NadS family protein [Gemmatimonadota bacterium]